MPNTPPVQYLPDPPVKGKIPRGGQCELTIPPPPPANPRAKNS